MAGNTLARAVPTTTTTYIARARLSKHTLHHCGTCVVLTAHNLKGNDGRRRCSSCSSFAAIAVEPAPGAPCSAHRVGGLPGRADILAAATAARPGAPGAGAHRHGLLLPGGRPEGERQAQRRGAVEAHAAVPRRCSPRDAASLQHYQGARYVQSLVP